MRVGIFYFSKKDAWDRVAIKLSPDPLAKTVGYVRCEIIEAEDESSALDQASPRYDETVMNSHEL